MTDEQQARLAQGLEEHVAVVIGPTAADAWGAPATPRVAIVGEHVRQCVSPPEALRLVAELESARHPRWTWWSAEGTGRPFIDSGIGFARAWDIAEAHRLIAGGADAQPGPAWAVAHELPLDTIPAVPTNDLFGILAGDSGDTDTELGADTHTKSDPEPDASSDTWAGAESRKDPGSESRTEPGSDPPTDAHRATHPAFATSPTGTSPTEHSSPDLSPTPVPGGPVRPDGHLRADVAAGTWQITDARLLAWAETLLALAAAQQVTAQRISSRLVSTIHAESAAAVLCEELRRDGLPVDRAALTAIVEPMCGPRQQRDARVLELVPGHEHADLRNPAQVRDLLRSVGIDAPNTRKWTLEPLRHMHPVVPALLEWRKHERIATTYGLRWMEEHIGADDRLRGGWRAADGAAGRMTAEAGLHNLPAVLRPGIAAAEGHVFVRADLGQIEPRVLAVVSGDRALADATQADDLYAPVAQRLGVDRGTAKIAVLAAMYGQRSGAAGQALRGLERAYPVAMRMLDAAYLAGTRGAPVRTFGGRLINTGPSVNGSSGDPQTEHDAGLTGARGRFARNAIIQGAAAELFKAWAATVRATTRHLGAQIVLCLHDELLVHTPAHQAKATAEAVDTALADAARRWSRGAPVRFVSDTSVVHRWSEADG